LALTTWLFAPLLATSNRGMPTGPAAWFCAAVVVFCALIALSASHDFRPKDQLGRAETTRWSYRSKRNHA
jgi:hypothetical protein